MNTHEQYVTLETAKLLKQAGFDWECRCYYDRCKYGFTFRESYSYDNYNSIDYDWEFSAPTQAMAMRWLREVKEWSVTIQHAYDYIHDKWIYQSVITNIQEDITDGTDLFFKETYEQAAEIGIQECLKMILNEQEQ